MFRLWILRPELWSLLATGLQPGTPNREQSEADMVHRFVSDSELTEMIAAGAVVDSHTLAALALY